MRTIWDKKLQLALIIIAFILGMAVGAHAQTYQTYGNTTYGSDGSTAQTYGNTTYVYPSQTEGYRPSVTCQTYGSTTYCN